MTKLLPFLLLGIALGSCKKDSVDLTPAVLPAPAGPVVVKAFAPVSGTIAIKPHGGTAYTVSGLQLQIKAESTANNAAFYYYTWHGLTPTGSGIEVVAKTVAKDNMTPGVGPWYAHVKTYTTAPDFTSPQGLDYAGTGILTVTAQGYTLPYTAQFIDGTLMQ